MNAITPERRIARYVTEFDGATLTKEDRHLVRRAILDTVACAIAGRAEPASQLGAKYCEPLTGSGETAARVWSDGTRLPVELAAWRNGIEAHVLDYDDVTSPLRGHPSIAILTGVLALAEARDLPLEAVEEAYAVGFEVICRLARAVAVQHYELGWHSTATIGALGGVVAATRLLRLDQTQVLNALGIAMAQLAGTRGNFGTMAKSLQSGETGQLVVRSALLAELGFDGAHDVLSGRQGFLALYTPGGSLEGALDDLDRSATELSRSGLEVKKYPLCYATHRALDAAFDLLAAHQIAFAEIETVEVHCSRGAFVPLIHSRPQTGLEGKFSIEYALAAALLDGAIGLSSFRDEAVQRAEIQAFLPRIRVVEGSGEIFPRWAEVHLTLRDGTSYSQRVEKLRGGAELPLTDAELLGKVRDCFAFSGSTRADAFAELLASEPRRSARSLIDTLAA